jgi:hypothetical protein
MSLSLSAAIKTKLELTASTWKPSAVVGCPAFRDSAPDSGQAYPYITMAEGLALAPSTAIAALGTEMVQVDVWQGWRPKSADDNAAGYDGHHKENPILGPQVAKALHLAQFETAPQRTFFATLANSVRLPDRYMNVVHTAITLYVRRIF